MCFGRLARLALQTESQRSANTAIAESKHPTFSPNTNLYTSIAKVKHTCCVYGELDNLLETVRGMFINLLC